MSSTPPSEAILPSSQFHLHSVFETCSNLETNLFLLFPVRPYIYNIQTTTYDYSIRSFNELTCSPRTSYTTKTFSALPKYSPAPLALRPGSYLLPQASVVLIAGDHDSNNTWRIPIERFYKRTTYALRLFDPST